MDFKEKLDFVKDIFTPLEEECNACPDCGAPIRAKTLQEGGGVECSEKCGYWFCY